jgi:hypothetical protein
MVGATSLTQAASDLQEFASAYSDAEVTEQIAILGVHALALSEALDRLRRPSPATA